MFVFFPQSSLLHCLFFNEVLLFFLSGRYFELLCTFSFAYMFYSTQLSNGTPSNNIEPMFHVTSRLPSRILFSICTLDYLSCGIWIAFDSKCCRFQSLISRSHKNQMFEWVSCMYQTIINRISSGWKVKMPKKKKNTSALVCKCRKNKCARFFFHEMGEFCRRLRISNKIPTKRIQSF